MEVISTELGRLAVIARAPTPGGDMIEFRHYVENRSSWAAAIVSLKSPDTKTFAQYPDPAINVVRAERGAQPIYSFRVVKIGRGVDSPNNGDEASGRLSPRLHWRRGHLRRIDQDHIVPIPPMLVGSAVK